LPFASACLARSTWAAQTRRILSDERGDDRTVDDPHLLTDVPALIQGGHAFIDQQGIIAVGALDQIDAKGPEQEIGQNQHDRERLEASQGDHLLRIGGNEGFQAR